MINLKKFKWRSPHFFYIIIVTILVLIIFRLSFSKGGDVESMDSNITIDQIDSMLLEIGAQKSAMFADTIKFNQKHGITQTAQEIRDSVEKSDLNYKAQYLIEKKKELLRKEVDQSLNHND